MARPKKPLAMQKGNLTVDQQDKKKDIENLVQGKTDNLKMPVWVTDKEAQKEFRRLVKELKTINAITNLDINNLAQYCVAYGGYVQATKELTGKTLTTTKQNPNGSYQTISNPLIKIQKEYADEMRKFACLCGLTFDSRAKIAETKIEKEKDKIGDTFGDI